MDGPTSGQLKCISAGLEDGGVSVRIAIRRWSMPHTRVEGEGFAGHLVTDETDDDGVP